MPIVLDAIQTHWKIQPLAQRAYSLKRQRQMKDCGKGIKYTSIGSSPAASSMPRGIGIQTQPPLTSAGLWLGTGVHECGDPLQGGVPK